MTFDSIKREHTSLDMLSVNCLEEGDALDAVLDRLFCDAYVS